MDKFLENREFSGSDSVHFPYTMENCREFPCTATEFGRLKAINIYRQQERTMTSDKAYGELKINNGDEMSEKLKAFILESEEKEDVAYIDSKEMKHLNMDEFSTDCIKSNADCIEAAIHYSADSRKLYVKLNTNIASVANAVAVTFSKDDVADINKHQEKAVKVFMDLYRKHGNRTVLVIMHSAFRVRVYRDADRESKAKDRVRYSSLGVNIKSDKDIMEKLNGFFDNGGFIIDSTYYYVNEAVDGKYYIVRDTRRSPRPINNKVGEK